MIQNYFKTNTSELEIVVHDLGGSGQPLLMAHAGSLCGRVWAPIAEHLQNNFRCFAVDLRAHGMSVAQDYISLNWRDIASDLPIVVSDIRKILDLAKDEPILGVGHSLGGTCLLLAELMAPRTFSNAWMFEPILFTSNPIDTLERTQQMVAATKKRKTHFESRDVAAARFLSKPPFDVFTKECMKEFVNYGLKDSQNGVELSCKPDHEAQIYVNANSGIAEETSKVKIPTRVVFGQDDGDRVPALKNALLQTEIDIADYSDLTHFGPQSHPELIANDIKNWFKIN